MKNTLIDLLDPFSQKVIKITRQDAKKLLARSLADIIWQIPVSLKLSAQLTESELEKIFCIKKFDRRHQPKTSSSHHLQSLQSSAYDNITFLTPSGEKLFKGDKKRALFYMHSGLVQVVQEDPPVLKLNFTPAGSGQTIQDDLKNECVCCAKTEHLTKHHVVPYSFRKHFPLDQKEHNHHDVVVLCVSCHTTYEHRAHEHLKVLSRHYNVDDSSESLKAQEDKPIKIELNNKLFTWDSMTKLVKCAKTAKTLLHYKSKIPLPRQQEMRQMIEDTCSIKNDEDLHALKELDMSAFNEHFSIQKLITQKALSQGSEQLHELQRSWRQHFLDTMNPQYLPSAWSVQGDTSRVNNAKKNNPSK